ncbi:MAG: hypothetical protein IKB98_03625 [Clostridia bacterium]|nr:hypothetical protein [Clostridia bacterium]
MDKVKKPCYFAQIFKSGYIIHALLFTALASTFIALGYIGGLWEAVKGTPYLIYSACVLGLFFVLNVIYVIAKSKKNKVGITDAIAICMILTAILFIVYAFVVLKVLSIFRIAFAAGLFVVGVALLIINAVRFDADLEESNVVYTTNSLSGYYKTIFKKYSFFGILCAAAVCTCFTTMLFHPAYSLGLKNMNFIEFAIYALPAILYLSFFAGSKKVVALDGLLIALTITFPLALVQILLFKEGQNVNLTLWAVGALVLILYTFIRYRTFDIRLIVEDQAIQKKSIVGYYFKTVIRENGILLILAVAGVLAISAFVIFPLEAISSFVSVVGSDVAIAPEFMLISIIDFAVIATLLVCIVFSFVNLSIRKTNRGDMLLFILIAFIMFGFVSLIFNFSIVKALIFIAVLIYALSIFFARARAVYYAE